MSTAGVVSGMTALSEELAAVVGPRWIRRRPAELAVFRADGLPTHEVTPGLAVLPGTREQVIEIVRILYRHRTPFVARGAGTGLSGGALAASDAVLIVLTRLTRIPRLDPAARRAVVEPGGVNARPPGSGPQGDPDVPGRVLDDSGRQRSRLRHHRRRGGPGRAGNAGWPLRP